MKTPLVLFSWGLAIFTAGLLPALAGAGTEEKPKPIKPISPSAIRKVDVAEFEKLWQTKTNVVLDVRTKKEFDAGHIPGAVNLDFNGPDFEQKLGKLSKEKTYLVHCGAGVRSARACEKMRAVGFSQLVDLAPGFKAWEKAGKKVEK